MSTESANEEVFLGIAHALFMNRLHVLRLTEVVRHNIRPNTEDQNMEVPEAIDRELVQQSFDYVLKAFPTSLHKKLEAAKKTWLRLS